MLRKLCLLIAAVCCLSVSANAQSLTDQIEVFGGYSFMHVASSPSVNTNGWELSGQYKVNPWLGAVVDVDGHYGNFQGVNSVFHDYLIGPQVSFPARVSPFAHVMVGGAHFGANGRSDTSVSYAYGVGIDTTVAPQLAWRIIQLDVVHSHLFNEAENNTRIATGIVFHF